MKKCRLPIGVQTFREIRGVDSGEMDSGCVGSYYVDKTPWIERMVDEGKYFFLSRPRRFGKSLLVDTIKELFEGNEPLFRGLAIHDRWDWPVRHPVVKLSFGSGVFTESGELQASVSEQFTEIEGNAGIAPSYETAAGRFQSVLRDLHRKTGRRVVVLVDEYDKPILDPLFSRQPDNNSNPIESKTARANRDFLRGFYAAVKDADAHIRFGFFTGVSKFSKVSLFSGLNILNDITLDRRYGAICGYTESDLDTVFASELVGLDREQIRQWYNGYCWTGNERVYNPFGVLMLFDKRRFGAWWFETGSPAFLVEALFRRRIVSAELDRIVTSEDLLSAFDVDHITTEALLFQTGYLTIDSEVPVGVRAQYRLTYPNLEVRQSLNDHMLRRLDPSTARVYENQSRLHELLETNNIAGLERLFHAFFAGVPHQWHINNNIARYEGYYASVFYSYFAALGLDVVVEESTSSGRLDMAVRVGGHVYIFEFKVIEQSNPGAALAQLKQHRYADRYRADNTQVHLIGVEFSSTDRNIQRFETETC
ncbi:MAG: ATP-binding protein [Acidimicrobiaceae bacterium]|nr:ATP-binding protein [Acidimicrobiaceae bacterium]